MCNSFLRVYRGFACAEEAIKVLENGTAGGLLDVDKEFLNEETLQSNITKQILYNEGVPNRILWDSSMERKGIIEYSLDPSVALGFGTLCTIGGDVKLRDGSYWKTENSECSIMLRQDCEIIITEFQLGPFFSDADIQESIKSSDLQKFSPTHSPYQTKYSKKDKDIMKLFIKNLSSGKIADLLRNCLSVIP